MTKNISDKWIFFTVLFYLPLSIFFVFWLYLVQIIYASDAWQYDMFYGESGTTALIWLFVDLLPACLFLLFKSRGMKFISRLFGMIGFYCLLGGIISTVNYLAYPGFAFLIMSIITRRMSKKI